MLWFFVCVGGLWSVFRWGISRKTCLTHFAKMCKTEDLFFGLRNFPVYNRGVSQTHRTGILKVCETHTFLGGISQTHRNGLRACPFRHQKTKKPFFRIYGKTVFGISFHSAQARKKVFLMCVSRCWSTHPTKYLAAGQPTPQNTNIHFCPCLISTYHC